MQIFISFPVILCTIFLIIFHAVCQCDFANVIADDVRKWGCEWDVVVTKNGETDCSLGDLTKSTIPPPLTTLYLVFSTVPHSVLSFYLHQSVHASFLWILLLFESSVGSIDS